MHRFVFSLTGCKYVRVGGHTSPFPSLTTHGTHTAHDIQDHPNIVRLEEVYESHSEIYLVQEVCKGGELFDRLD